MADTMDSKSIVSNDMWVRLPPPVFTVRKARFIFVATVYEFLMKFVITGNPV